MSRIIVKNLPKKFNEERFKEIFSKNGQVTDCKLLHTKDGKFRRFGFVGFKTAQEAELAQKHFHNSFIDTCKVIVEIAKDLGDPDLQRPWSKYSEKSSAYQKLYKERQERKERLKQLQGSVEDTDENKNTARKGKTAKEYRNIDKELEEDEGFMEFVQAHENRGVKKHWDNDASASTRTDTKKTKSKEAKEKIVYDEDDGDDDESDDEDPLSTQKGESESEDEQTEEDVDSSKKALDSKVSDMDYLKSFISKASSKALDSEEENDEEENEKEEEEEDSSDSSSESENEELGDEQLVDQNDEKTNLTLKMRGLPFKVKEKDIIDFFAPIKLDDIRLLKVNKKTVGVAYVDFACEKDLKAAMKRDKDCIKGRYIELFVDKGTENRESIVGEKEPAWMKKAVELSQDDGDETIAESGRLFLRNLPFCCTEEEIQEEFSKHGLLSEVYLPLNKDTNKPFGIGFVTYMMPEHAVKAFNELDGKVFQGRMLHILPAKAKASYEEQTEGGSDSYKTKKKAQQKALSGSSHNWNTLFLGVNAVADAMAEKYQTSKSGILDAQSRQSLAVRMALGETQVVSETREFLEAQGVRLDVFGQPSAQRSKTVILVKNLPFNTSPEELRQTFAPFGQVGRVVLPPTGITALVEFSQPSEAKKAFMRLAYTKFKDVPLYLEWAPMEIFSGSPAPHPKQELSEETGNKDPSTADSHAESQTGDDDADDDDEKNDEEDQSEEGCTLYVKNLNFDTTEDTLKEKFSSVGPVRSVAIAKKKDAKKPDIMLSMGYGFVEYKKKKHAVQAIKELQHCMIDGHAVELKTSNRKTLQPTSARKKAVVKKQTSSKILVRNIPFEASQKELKELFCTFGEIKTLRLPKKMAGSGNHRGFAFIDFLTKQDAKRAFKALATSTHLYGRRLVLEWAEDEDSIDSLRKRTADKYHESDSSKKKKTEEILKDMELD